MALNITTVAPFAFGNFFPDIVKPLTTNEALTEKVAAIVNKHDHHEDHHFTTKQIISLEESDKDFILTTLNSTQFGNTTRRNETFYEEEKPHWKIVLDKVVTYIMTFNVVGLMLGMGCAIYWREVNIKACKIVILRRDYICQLMAEKVSVQPMTDSMINKN